MASAAAEKALWAEAESLLPADEVGRYTQGLMDLGATLCAARNPACERCPVSAICAGRASGAPTRYPVKTRKLRRTRRENWWLWLQRDDAVLLCQRPDTGVWAGLWTLPLFDSTDDALGAAQRLGLAPQQLEALPSVQHALTHFDWTLHTARARLPAGHTALPEGTWVAREDLARYALPAPLKKLLAEDA
jgi:A/G-specific adenine glycosylase